ncbi:hypothetical protein D3C87_243460 [compost metagenome]
MKNILLKLCILFIGLSFNSCKKDKTEAVEEIGYGTSFGMCVGYCLNEVAIISSGKITLTKRANGINPSTKTCTKAIDESEVNILKDLVNTNEFAKLPEVIGCPDCADGGAEWISLRVEGKVKKVTFEHGKAPNELKELVQKLKGIKESFEGCN